MGKGSKARPMNINANEFWDNWDRVFGNQDEKTHDYVCVQCGGIDSCDVIEEATTDYEPHGDQTVPRTEIYLTCDRCGNDVEEC